MRWIDFGCIPAIIGAAIAAGQAPQSAGPPVNSNYDLIISGGKITDGTGAPWYYGDLGIRNGVISVIGKVDPATPGRRLDATGMVVAPGFIDIHTHARRGIFQDPAAKNYIFQGVISIFEGPDGS